MRPLSKGDYYVLDSTSFSKVVKLFCPIRVP